MHEHVEILSKYMLKMSFGANTNTNKHNGTQPNQEKKNCMNISFSNPFQKNNPTLEILKSKT